MMKPLCLALSALFLLTACQQRPAPSVAQETQVQQLSALIAAANWLRDNCARSDIPDTQRVTAHALAQAQARGWNTRAIASPTLALAAEQRYQALSDDNQTPTEKCAALNASAVPFLQQLN